MKYKKMLKKKDGKESDGVSTSRKSEQVNIIEEADENPCDVLTAQSRKESTQILGYLARGAHTICAQKKSGSVHTSLMMEALS